MNRLPNHTALKEWSTVVDALGEGRQVVLLRKGGIADPSFGIEADRFYLVPTWFHQGEVEPRPAFTVDFWGEVRRVWQVQSESVIGDLEPFVEMPRNAIENRYRFRPDQALFVIGIRAWRLATPVEVVWREAYGGCRSWVSLEEEIDVDGSVAVLSEGELNERLGAIERVIGGRSMGAVRTG